MELGALDYRVDMITGGGPVLQRLLTCASDLTIMIVWKEKKKEAKDTETVAGNKRDGVMEYIASVGSQRIDQVLTRPGSIRGHKGH